MTQSPKLKARKSKRAKEQESDKVIAAVPDSFSKRDNEEIYGHDKI